MIRPATTLWLGSPPTRFPTRVATARHPRSIQRFRAIGSFGGLAGSASICHPLPVRKTSKQEFSVIVERDDEGYYVASVPALPGCHTQARSLDKLVVRVREAIELCLEVDGSTPTVFEFVGVQRITV